MAASLNPVLQQLKDKGRGSAINTVDQVMAVFYWALQADSIQASWATWRADDFWRHDCWFPEGRRLSYLLLTGMAYHSSLPKQNLNKKHCTLSSDLLSKRCVPFRVCFLWTLNSFHQFSQEKQKVCSSATFNFKIHKGKRKWKVGKSGLCWLNHY